ncbi:MAG: hypothetical protein IJE43_02045 [Alphaproteobacteria bacterium]|nr:hypothetical protein [Alphaproteobacteria bacterium]
MKRFLGFIIIVGAVVCCATGCSKEEEAILVRDELVDTSVEIQTEIQSSTETGGYSDYAEDDIECMSEGVSSDESIEVEVEQIKIGETTGIEVVTGYPKKMAALDYIRFNLPVSLYFFRDLGFYFDETDENYIKYKDLLVEPGEKINATFRLLNDGYDNDLDVYVNLCSNSESLMNLEALDVYRLSIDASINESSDILKLIPEFEVEPGVFWNMSKTELISNLGEPTSVYSCDTYEEFTYDNYYTEVIVQIGSNSGVNKIVVDKRK